jgi:hypothetical protein
VLRRKGRGGGENSDISDLKTYVRTDLFRKLKFVMSDRQLVFSTATNSICYQICRDMGIREERSALWWEMYKTKMLSILNGKRADVTATVKRTFISKFA